MKKAARVALEYANNVAAAFGCRVVHAGMTGETHYRFEVLTKDGRSLGTFPIACTAKSPDECRNWSRQYTRRLIRQAGLA